MRDSRLSEEEEKREISEKCFICCNVLLDGRHSDFPVNCRYCQTRLGYNAAGLTHGEYRQYKDSERPIPYKDLGFND